MRQEEEEKFVLWPTISPSDKEIKAKVGPEKWEKMKSEAFRRDNYCCQGCTFEPYEVNPEDVLSIHVVKENTENPEASEIRTTCKLCHYIEHIDVAIDKGYVQLVNSHFSQGQLINICRNNSLNDHIENGDIRFIKKTPQEFLEEINNGLSKEGKVKVVFTEEFLQKLGISTF